MSSLKVFALGILTLLAFAGNSILNRYALIDSGSEPWSFTVIRLVSGAIMLAALTGFQYRGGTWKGAIALLSYAAFFSYAYLVLDAGLGALILFTWVQFTMLGRAAAIGERFSIVQWTGTILAFLALAWLLWPSENAIITGYSSILALGSMSFAGISWGIYSLIGRGATDPIAETSGNFSRATLIALIVSVPVMLFRPEPLPGTPAFLAAVTSGALTSGLGYAVWYSILPFLSRMQAGVMQLSVPAIASIGGVLLLGEVLTQRLAISTILILFGVGIATLSPRKV